MKTIQHEAFVNLYNKNKKVFELIFKDTKTLSQLSGKIIKVSKTFDKYAYKDADKMKGDLFEIFAECFFKLLSSDNRIGVYNYQPAPPIDASPIQTYYTGFAPMVGSYYSTNNKVRGDVYVTYSTTPVTVDYGNTAFLKIDIKTHKGDKKTINYPITKSTVVVQTSPINDYPVVYATRFKYTASVLIKYEN